MVIIWTQNLSKVAPVYGWFQLNYTAVSFPPFLHNKPAYHNCHTILYIIDRLWKTGWLLKKYGIDSRVYYHHWQCHIKIRMGPPFVLALEKVSNICFCGIRLIVIFQLLLYIILLFKEFFFSEILFKKRLLFPSQLSQFFAEKWRKFSARIT